MNNSSDLMVKTSAIALYDILKSVKESSNTDTIMQAWESFFQADRASMEFAKYHSEVAGLLSDLHGEIADLEPERIRSRLEKHLNSWWNSIVWPTEDWDHTNSKELISDVSLDMLGTACDLIIARRDGLQSTRAGSDLGRLRAECDAWLSLVSDNSEITDESFRQTLLMQLNHLIWLIDNADTFGISRIVQHGDQITGAVVRAAAHQGTIKHTPRFRDRMNGFVAALTLVASLIHSSQVVFDAADHMLPDAEKIINEITS
jgi:hypothetical protein